MTQQIKEYFGGHLIEHKQLEVNGVPVGEFTGLLATWQPDTGGRFGLPDQFEKGAFAESIREHVSRDNRQIRLKDHHGRTIGGFPIEFVRETDAGLQVTGHVNLEVEQGREAFALVKQGVLTDLSIGWIPLQESIKDDINVITKAMVMEGSLVSEPANQAATITEIKNCSLRELENLLINSGAFSQKAAKYVVHNHKEKEEQEQLDSILTELHSIKDL